MLLSNVAPRALLVRTNERDKRYTLGAHCVASQHDVGTCTACNSSGTTVHSLVVHRGYFRISNSTADVRLCPDQTAVVSLFSKPSGCKGGEGRGRRLRRRSSGRRPRTWRRRRRPA